MTRKILVPLDGSSFSERILAYMPALTRTGPVEVVMAYVVEAGRFYSVMGPDSLLTFDISYWHDEAEAYLSRIRTELEGEKITVRTVVLEGDVAGSLCDIADAHEVDLIAMTTHGRAGVKLWVMGSIADRVVRAAKQPVLLVRPSSTEKVAACFERILVPLDSSALAEKAVGPAQDLAQDCGGEIVLVQSVESLDYWVEAQADLHTMPTVLSVEEQRQAAGAYLDSVAARIRSRDIAARTVVTSGHAASAVAAATQEENIDLIVMSTHGRSGAGRWVFGSVAEKIVRMVDCPVLLVRATQPEGLWRQDETVAETVAATN